MNFNQNNINFIDSSIYSGTNINLIDSSMNSEVPIIDLNDYSTNVIEVIDLIDSSMNSEAPNPLPIDPINYNQQQNNFLNNLMFGEVLPLPNVIELNPLPAAPIHFDVIMFDENEPQPFVQPQPWGPGTATSASNHGLIPFEPGFIDNDSFYDEIPIEEAEEEESNESNNDSSYVPSSVHDSSL